MSGMNCVLRGSEVASTKLKCKLHGGLGYLSKATVGPLNCKLHVPDHLNKANYCNNLLIANANLVNWPCFYHLLLTFTQG